MSQISGMTRGRGRLTITEPGDPSLTGGCPTCDLPDAFDLQHVTFDGVTMNTRICVNCLAEAIAIFWGRKHLDAGGQVQDLVYGDDVLPVATIRPTLSECDSCTTPVGCYVTGTCAKAST